MGRPVPQLPSPSGGGPALRSLAPHRPPAVAEGSVLLCHQPLTPPALQPRGCKRMQRPGRLDRGRAVGVAGGLRGTRAEP